MVFSPFFRILSYIENLPAASFPYQNCLINQKNISKKSLKLLKKRKYEMLFFGKSSTIILAHQKSFFNTFWGIYHGIFPTLKP